MFLDQKVTKKGRLKLSKQYTKIKIKQIYCINSSLIVEHLRGYLDSIY